MLNNVRGQSADNIKWLDVITPDFFWSIMCHGISFGKPSDEIPTKSFYFDEGSIYTFMDTGASMI